MSKAKARYASADLFAGIGGIRLGFEQAFDGRIDTVFVSDIDVPAQKTYYANFGKNPEIEGDITKVEAKDVPDIDILCAGFPCFPAGTPVIVEGGKAKKIEDIVAGDLVLTHEGRYRKVLATGHREVKRTVSLHDGTGRTVTCTPNHPILWSHSPDLPVADAEWKDAEKCPGGYWRDMVGNEWVYISGISASKPGQAITVYNMEVEEDNSYTAHGIAVHNCQAFSIAGKKKGFDDDYKGRTRGTLFFDVARIADAKKPKVIFCENVKGLPMHDKGKTYAVIKQTLEELGYTVFEKVLNSKDFGVPQNRERIYIVAFRNDIAPETFEFPDGEGIEGKCLRDILDPAPIPSKYYISDQYLAFLKDHRARHEAKGHGFGYEIKDLDGIASAIVCGGMGRERNLVIDHREHSMVPTTRIKGEINDQDIRKLTPAECIKCQGFPDDYVLPLADTHIYKQAGNSVSVPVIKAIAEKIREVLEGE